MPSLPDDGTEYTANQNYGSGDDIDDDGASYVVNKNDAGTYSLVTNYVSNLDNNVSYAYRVFEYNGTSGVTKYNTSTANYNPTYRTASGCKVDGEAPSGIEVERFAARSSERTVVTEWSTVYEYGNAGFELYRADVEYGDSYELVATYKTNQTLVGQNYSPAGESYGVTDDDPSLVVGRTYAYRLVSVDLDGNRYDQAEQLVTITAGSNGAGGLEVSAVQPNPVYDHMSFTLALETDQNVTVEILDLTGKTIMVPVDGQVYGPGMHNIEVNFGQIASGTYIMSVTSGTDTHVQRFTIVR